MRDDLTIEHVLPEKWAEFWPLPDGAKAPPDYIVTAEDPRHSAIVYRQVLKHTLGNLTLLTPSGRRRFTFTHELGHHVFADEYSDEWIVGSGGDERERLINAFVIHFLMPRGPVSSRWQELDGEREPRQAAVGLGAEYGVSWTAVLGHLRHLSLIDNRTYEQLSKERPTKADYLASGVTLREEMTPPAVAPRYVQAVIRAFKRHRISRNRTLDLLHGTVSAEDLPPEDRIPVESMRAQFSLD